MRLMTRKEWDEQQKNEKELKEYLERTRQKSFAEEQRRESVMTRPNNSIVDVDN